LDYNDGMKQNRAAMDIQILVRGAMAVFYFDRLIALVNEMGLIVWRDEKFPIYLIEYLIQQPDHQAQWN